MLAIPRPLGRLTALASPIVAVVLLGLLARPAIETSRGPAEAAPLQLSASGKVIDRLPGNAPAAPSFDVPRPPPGGAMLALSGAGFTHAFAAPTEIAALRPESVPEARPTTAAPPRTARAPARPQKPTAVAAILPPPRPASLKEPLATIDIAAAPQRRSSVASRMIAFVGSLASLARPL